MNSSINNWAIKWGVSYAALQELHGIFGLVVSETFSATERTHSEAWVQSQVRLEAARKGIRLWRNNVGVMENLEGQPVRFGLANDSKRLNSEVKSGDLIGWRPLLITPQMTGSKVAQFVSRECKKRGWYFTGTDRERAQLRWAEVVNADGGDAQFATGEGSL